MTAPRARTRGFTVVEVLIALAVMAIGLVGVLALQKGAASASAFSRRATEAAVLAEDKLEELRTVPIATLDDGSDQIDAAGIERSDGLFARTWELTWVDDLATVVVTVTWNDGDGDHTITFRTMRSRT